MATDLDPIADLTGAARTEAQVKTWFTNMRAALAEMGDPMGKFGIAQNLTLAFSVAGNALTIALKDRDGSDPSAESPASAAIRSVTAASGDFSVANVDAAISLVVPDTATLGTANSTPFRLWVVLFNDGGTLRLGVINCRATGNTIYPLGGWQIASSTSIGTGSDSAQVFYSGTGVSSKAYAVLGYATWESGLATAGTWSSGPTRVQLFGPGVPLPGQVVQRVAGYSASGSSTTNTSATDVTNSSKSITPTSAANPVHVRYSWNQAQAALAANNVVSYAQVLRGATNLSGVDAFALTAPTGAGGIGVQAGGAFIYSDYPAATSSTTYKMQHRTDNGSAASSVSALGIELEEVMG